ncbi:bifunctional pyr operon transcriptional regulator/uracil phosphoribosyltransferase PyrR [Piscinibacterium candidicorallinum]|jgi:pyrimidine operon attenuation protein/uracil phosphoribosyltransferase|uniref:Bifunctional pyr operon transcriptional regulator/uracil phosphoribosyltransferase PyrR n=1 Tax=Piscinibacterium candidicorallinum TaxID=1793872 RepID=A0ABV7H568_9BURK
MTLPDFDIAYGRLLAALRARPDLPDALMIGIHSGGYWLAQKLHADLGLTTPLGALNVAFYRDDFDRIGLHPQTAPTQIPVPTDKRVVWLVDDVLNTGRTLRGAMNELFDYGRPDAIRLAVLLDRGGRELPVAPDASGGTIELPSHQHIKLQRNDAGNLSLTLEDRS